MNKKRWIAVGLSFVIMIISWVAPQYDSNKAINESLQQVNPMGGWMWGKEGIMESVLEPGDTDQRIVLLSLDGVISSAQGSTFSPVGYQHSFFMNQLEQIRMDPTVKAVVFSVNTPGGGVFESAEIRDKIIQIKEERDLPFYVSMQNMAASGGYYVSAPADKIFAHQETWTGSIGVILSSMNLSGLMEKYGVKMNVLKSGANKDMASPYREWNTEETTILQSLIDDSYNRFVDIVSEGRDMDKETVRKIADGRIYNANQALENGLIDEIASLEPSLKRREQTLI